MQILKIGEPKKHLKSGKLFYGTPGILVTPKLVASKLVTPKSVVSKLVTTKLATLLNW